MGKKFLISALIAGLLGTTVLSAATKIDQQDINSINKYAQDSNPVDIDDQIEEDIQQYAQKNHFEFGLDEKRGKYFIYAIESVALKPTDPDFVKSLSVGYEKAFFSAQEQFVMDIFGREASQKESQLFSDNSTDAREFASDKKAQGATAKIGRIFSKMLTLTEKSLDKALLKLGVQPDEISKLNKKEKKTLFKNQFIAQTMKVAYGSVSGFIPIKTFVGKDEQGQYCVGVIAMRSPKTSQVAKDISMQRESMIEGRGKDIKNIVPSDKKLLLNEFGLRLVFDASGRPALLAYGQWGFNAKGLGSYMKSQAKNSAKSMAQDMADSMISDFVNGYLQANSTTKRGEVVQKVLEREGGVDGVVTDKTIKTLIDKINKNAKITSSMKLAGVSTVRRWSTKNKYGLYVAGVVRKWTFGGLSAAKSVQSGRAMKAKAKHEKKSYTRDVQGSQEYNTVNDF